MNSPQHSGQITSIISRLGGKETIIASDKFDRTQPNSAMTAIPATSRCSSSTRRNSPHDVDFKIGTSDIKKDWNYAQWTWYNQAPVWKLRFQTPTIMYYAIRLEVEG